MGATASNFFCGGDSAAEGAADGPAPKRLHRASELPAIQSVEDLFPPFAEWGAADGSHEG